MTISENKQTVLSTLGSIRRPGMDKVLEYINKSNYFTARCYSHHKERGGLVQHSIEVYDYMKDHSLGMFTEESMALCALLHDLGKSRRTGFKFYGRHDQRSLAILDWCGLELSDAERTAILHHDHSPKSYLCPLRTLLSFGDCHSTGEWKRCHRGE